MDDDDGGSFVCLFVVLYLGPFGTLLGGLWTFQSTGLFSFCVSVSADDGGVVSSDDGHDEDGSENGGFLEHHLEVVYYYS